MLGASGFIGRWVARALCTQKAILFLPVRDRRAASRIFQQYNVHGDIVGLDLTDSARVDKFFRKVRPSITFNLAGYGVDSSERDEKTAFLMNSQLVRTVCEVIGKIRDEKWFGQDLVHVGSALEYGAIHGNLLETSIPNPTTLYGRSKLAGTQELSRCCKGLPIKGLTARLFTVYGPGELAGRLLPQIFETIQTGEPLLLTRGDQKRDFTYVKDVAEGLLRLGLARAQPGEIVNLATGRLLSVRSFVETAATLIPISRDVLKFGALPTRREEMEHDPVTLDRLRQLIAWIPGTGIIEGIKNTHSELQAAKRKATP